MNRVPAKFVSLLVGYHLIITALCAPVWIEVPSSNVEVVNGGSTELVCALSGLTPGILPTWTQTSAVPERTVSEGRGVILSQCSTCSITGDPSNGEYYLTINPITRDDAGTWACQVGDATPQSRTCDVFVGLNVQEITLLGYENGEVDGAQISNTYNLTCTTSNADPPPTIQWFINDTVQTSQTRDDEANEDGTFNSASTFMFTPDGSYEGQEVVVKCTATQSLLDTDISDQVIFKFAGDTLIGTEDDSCPGWCIGVIVAGVVVLVIIVVCVVYCCRRNQNDIV